MANSLNGFNCLITLIALKIFKRNKRMFLNLVFHYYPMTTTLTAVTAHITYYPNRFCALMFTFLLINFSAIFDPSLIFGAPATRCNAESFSVRVDNVTLQLLSNRKNVEKESSCFIDRCNKVSPCASLILISALC